jgi:hypothetical protein
LRRGIATPQEEEVVPIVDIYRITRRRERSLKEWSEREPQKDQATNIESVLEPEVTIKHLTIIRGLGQEKEEVRSAICERQNKFQDE